MFGMPSDMEYFLRRKYAAMDNENAARMIAARGGAAQNYAQAREITDNSEARRKALEADAANKMADTELTRVKTADLPDMSRAQRGMWGANAAADMARAGMVNEQRRGLSFFNEGRDLSELDALLNGRRMGAPAAPTRPSAGERFRSGVSSVFDAGREVLSGRGPGMPAIGDDEERRRRLGAGMPY